MTTGNGIYSYILQLVNSPFPLSRLWCLSRSWHTCECIFVVQDALHNGAHVDSQRSIDRKNAAQTTLVPSFNLRTLLFQRTHGNTGWSSSHASHPYWCKYTTTCSVKSMYCLFPGRTARLACNYVHLYYCMYTYSISKLNSRYIGQCTLALQENGSHCDGVAD